MLVVVYQLFGDICPTIAAVIGLPYIEQGQVSSVGVIGVYDGFPKPPPIAISLGNGRVLPGYLPRISCVVRAKQSDEVAIFVHNKGIYAVGFIGSYGYTDASECVGRQSVAEVLPLFAAVGASVDARCFAAVLSGIGSACALPECGKYGIGVVRVYHYINSTSRIVRR